MAARILADHWLSLALDGRSAAVRELLAGFPAELVTADAELTTLRADGEITRESLEEAERDLQHAAAAAASLSAGRRGSFHVLLVVQRLRLARARSDLPAAVAAAQELMALAETADAVPQDLAEDVRA